MQQLLFNSWLTHVSRGGRLLLLLPVLHLGCQHEVPVAPTEPQRVSESTDVEAVELDPAESSEPEFITVAQMRERLGVGDNAKFQRVGRGFVGADLSNTGLRNLGPLAGQPLHTLVIAKNPLDSLEPLAGMPLEILDFSETQVTSLAPLANCATLTQLFLEKCNVSDVSPLQGRALTHLYLTDCPVADLSPLAGMKLAELNVCRSKITSLKDLRAVDLGILWIRGTAITDLSPLAGKTLISLDIESSQVSDLSPLASISTLQRLDIADTPVTDLTPLAGLQLNRLIFTPARIQQGLEVIRNMASLREIDISFEGQQPQALPADEFWRRYDAGAYAATE